MSKFKKLQNLFKKINKKEVEEIRKRLANTVLPDGRTVEDISDLWTGRRNVGHIRERLANTPSPEELQNHFVQKLLKHPNTHYRRNPETNELEMLLHRGERSNYIDPTLSTSYTPDINVAKTFISPNQGHIKSTYVPLEDVGKFLSPNQINPRQHHRIEKEVFFPNQKDLKHIQTPDDISTKVDPLVERKKTLDDYPIEQRFETLKDLLKNKRKSLSTQ